MEVQVPRKHATMCLVLSAPRATLYVAVLRESVQLRSVAAACIFSLSAVKTAVDHDIEQERVQKLLEGVKLLKEEKRKRRKRTVVKFSLITVTHKQRMKTAWNWNRK
ncbi:uncharacterized protein LOC126355082 [Schistocerca gregaria]|uniref:uncharacterized protein LOC126355082 n=1 Tax=Schistocerca gregaria TaxID=7010 RepID=UPI00211E914B|nr:uncharacterized protein LOC126355082 [Schistocerca gregaria]